MKSEPEATPEPKSDSDELDEQIDRELDELDR